MLAIGFSKKHRIVRNPKDHISLLPVCVLELGAKECDICRMKGQGWLSWGQSCNRPSNLMCMTEPSFVIPEHLFRSELLEPRRCQSPETPRRCCRPERLRQVCFLLQRRPTRVRCGWTRRRARHAPHAPWPPRICLRWFVRSDFHPPCRDPSWPGRTVSDKE